MNHFSDSPAADAVLAAHHPSPEDGGPCATCAFRTGTEASQTPHTQELARLCVEGLTPFYCHERPRLCRGWIAAVNLNGVADDEDSRRRREVCSYAAEILAAAIERAAQADREAERTKLEDR